MFKNERVRTKKFSLFYRFSAYFLAFAMLLTGSGLTVLRVKAALDGSGTEASPYIIRTAEELYQIKIKPSAHYRLEADIDLEGILYSPMTTFKGVLNGNGHKISNLNVSQASNVGLFAQLNGALVKDLTFENASITATTRYAGVLAGRSTSSTLTNCVIINSTVTGPRTAGLLSGTLTDSNVTSCYIKGGRVYTTSGYAGGLTSNLESSTLFQCYTTAEVESLGIYAGGLAAYVYDSTVEQCFSTGSVVGAKDSGSLIAHIYQEYTPVYKTVIKDCFATGTVSSGSYAGGITYSTPYYTNIINCYIAAPIQGKTVTQLTYEPIPVVNEITSSYFDSDIAGEYKPAARARTTEQLRKKETYVDWDFENVWTIKEGRSYPELRFAATPEPEQKTIKMVLEVGDTAQLSLNKKLPNNTKMIWTSANASVASVNNRGLVTAIETGETTIHCQSADGSYEKTIHLVVVERSKNAQLAKNLLN